MSATEFCGEFYLALAREQTRAQAAALRSALASVGRPYLWQLLILLRDDRCDLYGRPELGELRLGELLDAEAGDLTLGEFVDGLGLDREDPLASAAARCEELLDLELCRLFGPDAEALHGAQARAPAM